MPALGVAEWDLHVQGEPEVMCASLTSKHMRELFASRGSGAPGASYPKCHHVYYQFGNPHQRRQVAHQNLSSLTRNYALKKLLYSARLVPLHSASKFLIFQAGSHP